MKYLTKNKYWDIVEDYNLDKLLYLLIDRPSEIKNCNTHIWRNDKNFFHRNYDLPSFIEERKNDCVLFWDYNGKKYRENNKPYTVWNNGTKEYNK